MQVLTCDECHNDFELDIKTEKLDRGIQRVYFNCNHCNKEYTSYYTNVLIRKNLKKIEADKIKLFKKLSHITDEVEYKKTYLIGTDRIDKLKKDTHVLMNEIR